MAHTLIPQETLDELRSRHRISDAVRRRTKLHRAGGEWKGLCPFHKERTASFFVNDVKGFAHCFGCGWNGDIIRFVEDSENVGFRDAVEMILGAALPKVEPVDRVEAREEDEAARRAAIEDAWRFWLQGEPVSGTPADTYLRSRGLHARDAYTMRFGRVPSYFDKDRGEWGPPRPALMLRADSVKGDFVGMQRIFLREDGLGKAAMAKPKLSLGRVSGASIRLGFVRPEVIATGGPEDGITLYQRFSGLRTVYISCGEAMLRSIEFPPAVRSIVVAGQNDDAGRRAVVGTDKHPGAIQVYREGGRTARAIFPDKRFKDWNDELRGRAAESPL
jgi:DNA primase